MNRFFLNLCKATFVLACSMSVAQTVLPPVTSTPLAAIPPNITSLGAKPMLMVAASKDHTLFAPIYTDFEDVDGDGTLDTTFLPTFTYYGFFDATKCYDYSSTNGRFEPILFATVTLVTTGSGASAVTRNRYSCPTTSSLWSGNFLNWATMTRVDVVRKMLYGGKRSTDSATTTVLERVNLSTDSHSFVKFYIGTDIRDFTPFTTAALTKTTGTNANVYAGLTICSRSSVLGEGGIPQIRMAKGNYRLWATIGGTEVCRWGASFPVKLNRYYDDADKGNGPIGHETAASVAATDGATFANNAGTTVGPDLTMRVQACVNTLVGTQTLLGREKCQAYTPSGGSLVYKPVGLFQKFGQAGVSATAALAEFGVLTGSYDQPRNAGALRRNMGDFDDEIDRESGRFCHLSGAPTTCATALADGRARGVGALASLDNIVLFGRGAGGDYAGSATQNAAELQAGGANVLPAWGNPIGEMVIQALQYFGGVASTNPTVTTNDTARNIPVATWLDPLRDPISNTTTRNQTYGKPICRALNVLALSSSSSSFDGDGADTPFATLPNRTAKVVGAATFANTLSGFTDAVGSAEGINNTSRSTGSANSVTTPYGDSCSAKAITGLSLVSGVCPEAPGIGGSYKVAGAALYANTNRVKTIAASDEPTDLPPTAMKVKTYAASLAGGTPRIEVAIPGTNPRRYVYITPEGLWDRGKVMPAGLLSFTSINAGDTYGTFVMSWNDALFGGDYDMDVSGFIRYDLIANGASPHGWDIRVTTDIVNVNAGATGSHGFSIIGAVAGGALPQDGRYLTHRHNSGDANLLASQGYLCQGAYLATNGAAGGGACNVSSGNDTVRNTDYPISYTFPMQGVQSVTLEDPLWYAAKYGSFEAQGTEIKRLDYASETAYQAAVALEKGTMTDAAYAALVASQKKDFSRALPSDNVKSGDFGGVVTRASWDAKRNDGNATCGGTTGVSCADGQPDGYFLARRPDLLEERITELLLDLITASNAAPAISSAQLNDGDYKYIAQYDQDLNLGSVYALQVLNNGSGDFPTVPTDGNLETAGVATWSTGKRLRDTPAANRHVITNDGLTGVAFATTTTFSADYTNAMRGVATSNVISDAFRLDLIDFMRGDATKEVLPWRTRPAAKSINSIMGSVINSSPWIQSAPNARFLAGQFPTGTPSYTTFAKSQAGRNRLLWVGANDGMLHSFRVKAYSTDVQRPRPETDPENGQPVLSYVPSPLVSRLKDIARDGAGPIAGMDGSPFTGDIIVNNSDTSEGTTPTMWRTYLFSSLGRGGRAIFALDVTKTGIPASSTPSALTQTNASSIYKWTFSNNDDADLGYVLGDYVVHPSSGQATPIVRLNNGKFAVIVPNGIDSPAGRGYLYLVQTDGPDSFGNWGTASFPSNASARFHKLPTDTLASGNGLAGANWVDLDNNGTADLVYATDLKGRLWKFDISSSDPANWKSALPLTGTPPVPFFEAMDGTTRLPITTAPAVSYPPFGGVLISFGTGKSILSGDFPLKTQTQRFYTLWDSQSASRALPPSDMSTLVERQFTRTADGSVYISGSTASINWNTRDGWYMNFSIGNATTGTSEMLLSMPEYRANSLAFTTVRPPSTTANTCIQAPEPSLFVVDPISGLPSSSAMGTVTVMSGGVETLYTKIGGAVQDQKVRFAVDNTTKTVGGGGGAGSCPAGYSSLRVIGKNSNMNLCFSQGNARIQWREIPGLRTQ